MNRVQNLPVSFAALTALTIVGACGGGGSGRDEAPTTCVTPLLAGDVVISEIMVNPPGSDAGNEWVELYNPGSADLDLAGLVLRIRKTSGDAEDFHLIEELEIGSQEYVVLGDADPEALPEYMAYSFSNAFGAGFNNEGGEIAVGCGSTTIDAAPWLYPIDYPREGASWSFDGTRTPDAVSNDDLDAWCDSTVEFEPDAFGTPAALNSPCSAPTTCFEGGVARPLVPPGPGDLVINEYMPNPSVVDDAVGEWFEIYVASDVDLNNLEIIKFGAEEPSDVLGTQDCVRATAGSYLVFAREADPSLNGGIQPDFEFSAPLSNTRDDDQEPEGFSIAWGGQVLDTVTWRDSEQGASSSLDPGKRDPDRNDEEFAFCEAVTPYGPGDGEEEETFDLGTPGGENPPCPVMAPPGSCVDADGNLREIVKPQPGDVWFTEFMANPSVVGDPEGEWFEMYANADFDINELQFGRNEPEDPEDDPIEDTVEIAECVPVSAGDYLFFAKNLDRTTNGSLPDALHDFNFSLVNTDDGRLFAASDGEVLDVITWTAVTDGASRALDPSVSGPEGNDEEFNWCDGSELYNEADLGTPAEENLACGGTPPGTCNDGGNVRDIVFASEGDLVITEWMPSPDAVGHATGEYFEVLVNTNVDLNGLQFGDNPEDPDVELAASGDCLPVTAGTRLVFARSDVPEENGGIDDVFTTFGYNITGNDVLFVGVGGTVIDEVAWKSATDGSSTSVRPGFENAVDNDDPANHCTSNTTYGAGDNGTPGSDNACGPAYARRC